MLERTRRHSSMRQHASRTFSRVASDTRAGRRSLTTLLDGRGKRRCRDSQTSTSLNFPSSTRPRPRSSFFAVSQSLHRPMAWLHEVTSSFCSTYPKSTLCTPNHGWLLTHSWRESISSVRTEKRRTECCPFSYAGRVRRCGSLINNESRTSTGTGRAIAARTASPK